MASTSTPCQRLAGERGAEEERLSGTKLSLGELICSRTGDLLGDGQSTGGEPTPCQQLAGERGEEERGFSGTKLSLGDVVVCSRSGDASTDLGLGFCGKSALASACRLMGLSPSVSFALNGERVAAGAIADMPLWSSLPL